MKRRWQFRLASLFGVILVVALLANLARLGYSDVAIFLGGAILGSFAPRRFVASVVGGALGGIVVVLSFLIWAMFFVPRVVTPDSVDVSSVPGMPLFIIGSVAPGSLALGAAVGAAVWVIKFAWRPKPSEHGQTL